jgi:DnaJ homolog subfamily C member 17
MSSTDELSAHATSSVDFYALLSLHVTATDSQIRSAFRKTSLKYHPDKVGATPENVEKFLLVKTAHDVLSDLEVRALYDQTREAKERKKAETEKLEAGRRKMVSDLERREQGARNVSVTGILGVKRSRSGEEESPEQKLEREIRRISEENRLKKEAMMETRGRERLEEEERLADEKEARERLRRAKERDGLKVQNKAPKFPSPTRTGQGDCLAGLGLLEPSPKNGSTFEQTILEKLKMAQREKERKRQLEAERSVAPSQET